VHSPAYTSSRAALAELVLGEIIASGRYQADVCAAVGITEKHMSRFVNGRDGMSLDLIDEVLAELGRGLVLATRVLPSAEVPDGD
jgi:plasmid maintenance system antidote protein VapI